MKKQSDSTQSPANRLVKEPNQLYLKSDKEMPEMGNIKGNFVIFSFKPNKQTILLNKDTLPEPLSEERKKYRDLLDQKNRKELEAVKELLSTPYPLETLQEMYKRHYHKVQESTSSKGKKETEE